MLRFDAAAVGLQVVGLGVLIATGWLSAVSSLALAGACCAVVGVVWLRLIGRQFSLRVAHMREAWQRNWNFAKWVILEHTAAVINSTVMQWLLVAMLDESATGIFAACAAILNVFNPISLGINNLLMPRVAVALAESGPREVRRVVRKATLAMVSITAVFTGTMIVGGMPLMHFLYGDKYYGQESTITVLALDLLVQSLASASSYGLWALQRSRTLFFIRLLRIAMALVISVCLIPSMGAVAAAYGLLISNVTGTALTWWIHNRLLAAEEQSTAAADCALRGGDRRMSTVAAAIPRHFGHVAQVGPAPVAAMRHPVHR